MNRKIVVAVIAVVVIALLIWWFRQPDAEPEPIAPAETPTAVEPQQAEPSQSASGYNTTPDDDAGSAATEPAVEPPPTLADSDEPAQEAAAELSPQLVRWITPQEKVRKLVLLVDLAASGRVPVKNRPVTYPAGDFKVEQSDGEIYLDEANYERATQLINTVTAIPPQQLVRYYRSWEPLLEEAYSELGRQEPFDARLLQAMEQVLATEPLEGEVRLNHPSVFYTYADPQLEQANDVSKLMWRMGPENTRKLQEYVRELQPLLEQELE